MPFVHSPKSAAMPWLPVPLLPSNPCFLSCPWLQVRDSMHSRAYIGQYSPSGEFFIAAYQVSSGCVLLLLPPSLAWHPSHSWSTPAAQCNVGGRIDLPQPAHFDWC